MPEKVNLDIPLEKTPYIGEVVKRECYKCSTETKQKIEYVAFNSNVIEVFFERLKGESRWLVELTILSMSTCNGCDSTNFEGQPFHLGPLGHNRNLLKPTQFPSRNKPIREVPKWIFTFERDDVELLVETYNAFNSKMYRLCSMGTRTVIDRFISKKVGTEGTFRDRLKLMSDMGYLGSSQFKILLSAIDAGSASSHRNYKPTQERLHEIFDIMEHLIQNDILEKYSKNLFLETPKREKRSIPSSAKRNHSK